MSTCMSCRTRASLVVLLLAAAASPLGAASPDDLEILSAGFPRTMYFRGRLDLEPGQGDVQVASRFNGLIDKFLREELNRRPEDAAQANRWKAANGAKMLLLHLNGEARAAWPEEVHDRYFPGHWVYYPGSLLAGDIPADATVLRVEDARQLERRYIVGGSRTAERPLADLLLVALDDEGRRQWDQSEFVSLVEVDAERKRITVRRGQYGSVARSFRADRTYVAPLVGGVWGGHVLWFYNLSTACPRDSQGHSAADVFLAEIDEWFGPGGLLEDFDGIGFDVNYFSTKWGGFDVDSDGVADEGIDASGRNIWRDGDWEFLTRLRRQMGQDFLLTGDGWNQKMQMAVGVMNGIESEGLAAPNDGWRRFGQTLNVQTYWLENNTTKHRYSYITAKLRDPDDLNDAIALRRLGAATACCLGVAYTQSGDYRRRDDVPLAPELTLDGGNWLGQPVGPMVVTASKQPDRLLGAGRTMSNSFLDGLSAEGCRVERTGDGALRVVGTDASPYTPMTIRFTLPKLEADDVTLSFEAMAEQPLAGFASDVLIPRQIQVRLDGVAFYEADRSNDQRFNGTMALMGPQGFTRQYAYFRRAAPSGESLTVSLTIEEQGACLLRNVTVHDSPPALAREFEHGIVLANPAEYAQSFDLERLLPNRRTVDVRRVRLEPSWFTEQDEVVREMLEYNDGRVETNTEALVVPPRNGLFLRRAVD